MNALPTLTIPSLTPWQTHLLTLSNIRVKEEYEALQLAVKNLATKLVQTSNVPIHTLARWEVELEGLRQKVRETLSELNRRAGPRAPAPSVSPSSQSSGKVDTPLSWFSNGSAFSPFVSTALSALNPLPASPLTSRSKSISPSSSSSSRASFNSPLSSPVASPKDQIPILRFS